MASEKAAVQTTEKKENFESVIIRSFLNLEKIDVDLYRYSNEFFILEVFAELKT